MSYTDQNRKDDFNWFTDNYDNIYSQYGECYVVIKDKCILGTYNSFYDGIEDAKKTYELGTFIIQYCDGTRSAYTTEIYSPRFQIIEGELHYVPSEEFYSYEEWNS